MDGDVYFGSYEISDDREGPSDDAPTDPADQSCAFCRHEDVTWLHPLDSQRAAYRVGGEGYTLPAFWALCDRCEDLYQRKVDQELIALMSESWPVGHGDTDRTENFEKPLAVFREADRGARRYK